MISRLRDDRERLTAELARKDEEIRGTAANNILSGNLGLIGTTMLGVAGLVAVDWQRALAAAGVVASASGLATLAAATQRARCARDRAQPVALATEPASRT